MTTTNRVRAGRPVEQMTRAEAKAELNQILAAQLHRVPAQPIDFVLPDDDEQAVRNGFDEAMKAPISKPIAPQGCTGDCNQGRDCTCQAETISEFSADVMAATVSFWIWSGLMWTGIWFCLGFIFARNFS